MRNSVQIDIHADNYRYDNSQFETNELQCQF